MAFDVRLEAEGDVVEALVEPRLVPPGRPNPDDRAVLTLRSSMARFSSGADHAAKRSAVQATIDAIADHPFAARARADTIDGLAAVDADNLDALVAVGRVVPVRVMLGALGFAPSRIESAASDVEEVVAVIGRGDPPTDAADLATDRLLGALELAPGGPHAAVSLLYQSVDATTALLAVALVAESIEQRAPALVRTLRTATADLAIGDIQIREGASVEVSLDHPTLEFGAGPHECPGRAIAEQLVDGMLSGISAAGFEPDRERASTNDDGKPTAIPLLRLDAQRP